MYPRLTIPTIIQYAVSDHTEQGIFQNPV